MSSSPDLSLDFVPYVDERTQHFSGRRWLFAALDAWVGNPRAAQTFLICGEPGSGKTAIAGRIYEYSRGIVRDDACPHLHPGFLAAAHFCSARDTTWISPVSFARSIALQLSRSVPEFAPLLAKSGPRAVTISVNQQITSAQTVSGVEIGTLDISGLGGQASFSALVIEPLKALYAAGYEKPIHILVDSLDESLAFVGDITIASLIASVGSLPLMHFIATTRPIPFIVDAVRFSGVREVSLSEGLSNADTMSDVEEYIAERFRVCAPLRAMIGAESSVAVVSAAIARKSAGNFLYAVKLLEMLETDGAAFSPTMLDRLPVGLDAVYKEFLRRRLVLDQNGATIDVMGLLPFLGTLGVSREPLTEERLAAFLGRKRSEVHAQAVALRQLLESDESLPAAGRSYALFHRSFVDFLFDADRAGQYWVVESECHERISDAYVEKEDTLKLRRAEDPYLWRYLIQHVLGAGKTTLADRLLLSYSWLKRKLEYTDIAAVLADFTLPSVDTSDGGRSRRLVGEAISLSADVLRRHKAELPSQLYGRLMTFDDRDITRLLADTCAAEQSPWIRTVLAELMTPQSAFAGAYTATDDRIVALAISTDGSSVFFATEPGQEPSTPAAIKLFRPKIGGDAVAVFAVAATALALSSDARILVYGCADGTVQFLSLSGDVATKTVTMAAKEPIVSLGFSVDDRRLGVFLATNRVEIWDVGAAAPAFECAIGNNNMSARDHAIAPDPDLLVICNTWSVDEVTLRGASPSRQTKTQINDVVAVNPAGTVIAVSGADGTQVLKRTAQALTPSQSFTGTGFISTAIAVDAAGGMLAVASFNGFKMWDVRRAANPQALHPRVDAMAILPGGTQAVVSHSGAPAISVVDLATGTVLRTAARTPSSIPPFLAAIDEHRVLLVDGKQTFMFDASDGSLIGNGEGFSTGVCRAMLPDRSHAIVASSDGTFAVWDFNLRDSLQIVKTGLQGSPQSVAVFPDGKRVVLSYDYVLYVWDLDAGRLVQTLKGHTWYVDALAVAATASGPRIVSGSRDRSVRIWDPERTEALRVLNGHSYTVDDLAISPDDRRVASACADGLRVWDIDTGALLATFSPDASLVSCVTVPRSTKLVATDRDKRLHVFDYVATPVT